MRAASLLLAFIALTFGRTAARAQGWGQGPAPQAYQVEHEKIAGYELTFESRFQNDLGEPFDQTFTVTQGGKQLARFTGYQVSLRDADGNKPYASLLEVVKDATGDGVPDLIVETYSGREHCCWGLHIASLGAVYKPLFDAKKSNIPLQVVDPDHNGRAEIVQHDLTFNDFWEPVGDSPSAEVLLASTGSASYGPSAALTRSWNERKLAAAHADTSQLGTLQQALDLVYAGKAPEAEARLSERWDSITRGTSLSFYDTPRAMMDDLWCRLNKSPYGATIFEINRRPPPACQEARLTPYYRWLDHEKDKRKELTTK